jgi:hypothetical protein
VLLLYAGAASPVGLEMTALLGALDTTHQVAMHAERDGVQVVLHHRRNSTAHHHGLAAKALTFFSHPASANAPDHVLLFRAPGTASKPEQFSTPTPLTFEAPPFACLESALPDYRRTNPPSMPPRPPTDAGGNDLFIRSTILLL